MELTTESWQASPIQSGVPPPGGAASVVSPAARTLDNRAGIALRTLQLLQSLVKSSPRIHASSLASECHTFCVPGSL